MHKVEYADSAIEALLQSHSLEQIAEQLNTTTDQLTEWYNASECTVEAMESMLKLLNLYGSDFIIASCFKTKANEEKWTRYLLGGIEHKQQDITAISLLLDHLRKDEALKIPEYPCASTLSLDLFEIFEIWKCEYLQKRAMVESYQSKRNMPDLHETINLFREQLGLLALPAEHPWLRNLPQINLNYAYCLALDIAHEATQNNYSPNKLDYKSAVLNHSNG